CSGTADVPTLGQDWTVGSLLVSDSAQLRIAANVTLSVVDTLEGGVVNAVSGTATVRLTGGAATLEGTVPELSVSGGVTVVGDTLATQARDALAGGWLEPAAGATLTTNGSRTTRYTAAAKTGLRMVQR